eukprot:5608267-Pyramimonas_sp.AAC.1
MVKLRSSPMERAGTAQSPGTATGCWPPRAAITQLPWQACPCLFPWPLPPPPLPLLLPSWPR